MTPPTSIPPPPGKGLNTGIQDAYNLAWKLAMVVHGHADAGLLDTYDAERVPIGQALLASTGEVMNTAMVDTATHRRDTQGLRQRLRAPAHPEHVGSEHRLPRQLAHGARRRPGCRVHDRASDSPRSPPPMPNHPAGRHCARVLRNPAWHLLVFAGDDRATRPDPVAADTTVTAGLAGDGDDQPAVPTSITRAAAAGVWDPDGRVQDTLAATEGDWILVRPDGYLSARGTGNTSLHGVLAQLTGPEGLLHTD